MNIESELQHIISIIKSLLTNQPLTEHKHITAGLWLCELRAKVLLICAITASTWHTCMCSPVRDRSQTYVITHTPVTAVIVSVSSKSHCFVAHHPGKNTVKYYKTQVILLLVQFELTTNYIFTENAVYLKIVY